MLTKSDSFKAIAVGVTGNHASLFNDRFYTLYILSYTLQLTKEVHVVFDKEKQKRNCLDKDFDC